MSAKSNAAQEQRPKITVETLNEMFPDSTWQHVPLCVLDGADIVPAGSVELISDRYGRRAIVLKPNHLNAAIAGAQ